MVLFSTNYKYLGFLFLFSQKNCTIPYGSIRGFQSGGDLLTGPVAIYSNAELDRSKILSDNKRKAGIYQWKHNESGKIYIGSAADLAKRLSNYFNKS